MEQQEVVKYCITCGSVLIPEKTKSANKRWHKDEILPYCVNCQQRRFDSVVKSVDNRLLAIYITCNIFDTPYYKNIATDALVDIADVWKRYLRLLKENNLNKDEDGETLPFWKGETDIAKVIYDSGIKITSGDARERWGKKFTEDGVSADYTDSEIAELESLYEEQAAEYKGQITARVEMSLRELCICRLEWKKCVGAGDSAGAKRYSDMIKDAMAREGMRAGDAKPLENVRIDSIVDHLEKKGMVQQGKIVGREELIRLLNEDHPQYHTSYDAIDCMMMAIINTMRKNNGDSELYELPLEAQVKDRFGEFLSEPTEQEKKVMRDLGILPPTKEQPKEY